MILELLATRLYEVFEKYPRRWKLQNGILERDFQKLCLDLSKFNELKQFWIENSIIKKEMFDSLMENTKYVCSNENLWIKLNENKSEMICKSFSFFLNLRLTDKYCESGPRLLTELFDERASKTFFFAKFRIRFNIPGSMVKFVVKKAVFNSIDKPGYTNKYLNEIQFFYSPLMTE